VASTYSDVSRSASKTRRVQLADRDLVAAQESPRITGSDGSAAAAAAAAAAVTVTPTPVKTRQQHAATGAAANMGRLRSNTANTNMSSNLSSFSTMSASGSASTKLPSSSSSSGGGVVSSTVGSRNLNTVRDEHLSAQQFALLPESKLLFSCGHWDHSFRVTHVESGRLLQSVCKHSDVSTCLALASDFGQTWLVTGSRDCTLMVWEVTADKDTPFGPQPIHILYGHDDAVTCVAIDVEMDVVVSGSDDGTIIVHNLRDGAYVRSIISGVTAGSKPAVVVPTPGEITAPTPATLVTSVLGTVTLVASVQEAGGDTASNASLTQQLSQVSTVNRGNTADGSTDYVEAMVVPTALISDFDTAVTMTTANVAAAISMTTDTAFSVAGSGHNTTAACAEDGIANNSAVTAVLRNDSGGSGSSGKLSLLSPNDLAANAIITEEPVSAITPSTVLYSNNSENGGPMSATPIELPTTKEAVNAADVATYNSAHPAALPSLGTAIVAAVPSGRDSSAVEPVARINYDSRSFDVEPSTPQKEKFGHPSASVESFGSAVVASAGGTVPPSAAVSVAAAPNTVAAQTMTPSVNSTSTSATPEGHQRRLYWVGVSRKAYIVCYCSDDQSLRTYTLNGQLLAYKIVPENLYAFEISQDGNVLITGGSSCLVVFRWVSSYF
jgi:WD40 repeat protein